MEYSTIAQAILALIFVIGLIGVIALLARRYGLGVQAPIMGTKNKRVIVQEITPVDAKRRLVLVRRDDREHLILLGMNGEQVIETNIKAGQTPNQAGNDSHMISKDQNMDFREMVSTEVEKS